MIVKKLVQGATLLIILCASLLSWAAPIPLKPTGRVNDFAGVINQSTKSNLDTLLTSLENATSIEAAVVTVPSLNDIPVEDYATQLFEQWGIGKKGKDNGLLILVAPVEKKMRIEVGYGLEGAINDAVAGRIIRDTMIPWFKNGDMSTGILNGVVESITILNTKYNLGFDPASAGGIETKNLIHVQEKKTNPLGTILKIIFIGLFILFFIKNPLAAVFAASAFSNRSGGGFTSGGFGGGGGFGGFGGGMSGGGGASGSW